MLGFPRAESSVVQRIEDASEEMVTISVPALTYALDPIAEGRESTSRITISITWIKEQGYSEYNPGHLTHFDQYPMSQNPYADDPDNRDLLHESDL